MNRSFETIKRIRSDISDGDLLAMCERIVNKISKENAANLAHLSYAYFFDLGEDRELVMKSIHYLAGDVGFLKTRFEFITEDENIFELQIEEIQQNEQSRAYFDPHGEQIAREEFYKHVYSYFSADQAD